VVSRYEMIDGWYFDEKSLAVLFAEHPYTSFNRNERKKAMCRNIKPLFNFEPPVSEDEIHAASLQFVRKITGFNKPSKANEADFQAAVDAITVISRQLLSSLETTAPPKNREVVAIKARERSAQQFAK